MACSHKKRVGLLVGTWKRDQPKSELVGDDHGTIWYCPSCGAIRIDVRNECVYRVGCWSGPQRYQTRWHVLSALVESERKESDEH